MKAVFAVALCALVALAQAKPSGDSKNLVTDIIHRLIDANRDKLANVSIPLIDLKEFGTVTDLLVEGAENFVDEILEACGQLSLNICNATITLTEGRASALIDAKDVDMPEIGAHINGKGPLKGVATGIWATWRMDLKLKGTGVEMSDFSGFAVKVDKIEATITGIDNEAENNEILSTKLADFVGVWLPAMSEKYKPEIIAAINEILGGLIGGGGDDGGKAQ